MSIIETNKQLRAHWGATEMPFQETTANLFEYEQFTKLADKLMRYISMKTSGLLTGPNGSGKTVLLDHVLHELPEQQFMVVRLSHSTLTGSDMIRRLCRLYGLTTSIRRSDNIHHLLEFWNNDGRIPVLAVDEAQNLNPATLEEFRLLNCERTHSCGEDAIAPFSMILFGDEDLAPTIELNVHRSLRSRLSFHMQMNAFDAHTTREYCLFHWNQVGVQVNPFDEQTINLLHSASEGLPRIINQLAGNAILCALDQQQKNILVEHLHEALSMMPWIGRHPR